MRLYALNSATTASRQFLGSPFSSIAAIKLPVSVKRLEQIRQFASVQVLLCMQNIRNCSKYYGLRTPDLLEKVMMCPIQVRFTTATGISQYQTKSIKLLQKATIKLTKVSCSCALSVFFVEVSLAD